MITHYVAGFYFSDDFSNVILIKKAHPKWQAGLLNGVGGKVEFGEDAAAAMRREFEEETSIKTECWNWKLFARLQGISELGSSLTDWFVDWFWTFGPKSVVDPIQLTDEKPGWFAISELMRSPKMMIANLRYLLPMALNDVERRDACMLFTINETESRST